MEHKYKTYFFDWIEGKISDKDLKKQIPYETYLYFLKIKKNLDLISDLEQSKKETWETISSQIDSLAKAKTQARKSISLLTKIAVPIAAMLLIFVGIKYFSNSRFTEIITQTGEQKTIVLPDESIVILGPQSEIRFKKKWNRKREIFLKGTAFFKVQKGNTFKVITSQGNVSVLGTQFDVFAQKYLFKTFCYQGKVRVETGKQKFILTPGKGILKIDNHIKKIEKTSAQPSWTKGVSSFDDVPLQMVINEMKRYYPIDFQTNNINLNQKFSGSFEQHNLQLALQSVFKPLRIKYIIKGNQVILTNEK